MLGRVGADATDTTVSVVCGALVGVDRALAAMTRPIEGIDAPGVAARIELLFAKARGGAGRNALYGPVVLRGFVLFRSRGASMARFPLVFWQTHVICFRTANGVGGIADRVAVDAIVPGLCAGSQADGSPRAVAHPRDGVGSPAIGALFAFGLASARRPAWVNALIASIALFDLMSDRWARVVAQIGVFCDAGVLCSRNTNPTGGIAHMVGAGAVVPRHAARFGVGAGRGAVIHPDAARARLREDTRVVQSTGGGSFLLAAVGAHIGATAGRVAVIHPDAADAILH